MVIDTIGIQSNDPSYEAPTITFDRGPKRDDLNRGFNALHEARRNNDAATCERLVAYLENRSLDYERTEACLALNTPWRISVMRAAFESAKGEYEMALRHEREGWQHACNSPTNIDQTSVNHMKSISASNMSDLTRRLNRSADAVEWGLTSVDLWASNPVNTFVLALALYVHDRKPAANTLFEKLAAFTKGADRKSMLASCIFYESQLKEMGDLPIVNQLLDEATANKG